MLDQVPLAGDWALWRDFAVRSAGFPVSGLEAFGPGDEGARLREVARDPLFREAVTWQNPAAFANAVLKVAEGAPTKPSRARQREEIVASYWQRYCAKNDTIGFFGPLAWGRVSDDGPPLGVRSGALVRERTVHLEAWAVQALAAGAERDLRAALVALADPQVRGRGLAALDRLEGARDAVAQASPAGLVEALAALDATFTELTGREPVRNAGRAYGARTLCYVDCMRDLDVTIGPALTDRVAPAMRTLFEAGRWFCGRVNGVGQEVIERALPAGGRGPFGPFLGRVLGTLMREPPELGDHAAELQRRIRGLLADADPSTIGARAEAAFADRSPAWPHAVFQSVDLQIGARDPGQVGGDDWLAVIGDVHLGSNPLMQGVFAHRHPSPPGLLDAVAAAVGTGVPVLLPPFGPQLGVEARGFPLLGDDVLQIAATSGTWAQAGRRAWQPEELLVDGTDLVDRTGALRAPLATALWLPIFIAGVRSFALRPDDDHAPRITIGRTVLAREAWSVPTSEIPDDPRRIAAFARDRGMPRRLFTKSPLERKPMYLDAESLTLARVLCRHARHAAAESPGARIRFTEMLPTPDGCWLADPEGGRYVCELRLVGVDDATASRRRGGSRSLGERRPGRP
jgi:Lantibiotic dehydratase, N terminus